MRLCLVSHNYAPEPTGIPYYNTAMAEWFVRRGWDVTVMTGLPHYPWWRVPDDYSSRDYRSGGGDESINGVRVRRVRHFVPAPPPGGLGRIRLDASFLANWFMRSAEGGPRPDAIIGVAPPFLVGGLLLWLRRRLRVPVVYHVQDLQVDAALDLGLLPPWLGGALRMTERWQLERVDRVAACGRGMLPRLAAKGRLRHPPLHWPNWADCAAIRPWEGPNPERPALDRGRDGTVVGLYSGSLGAKQGLDVLLEAHRLLADLPGWRLVIAGSGAERAALERRADGVPGLELQDLRPPGRLAGFLSAADIHLVPQRREAADLVLPSKLLNIMAVGGAVVTTAEPGTELHQAVVDAGCGIAVPPGSPGELAAAIRALATDPARRRGLGAAGRAWVERHYGIDAVLGAREADLRAIAALGPGG